MDSLTPTLPSIKLSKADFLLRPDIHFLNHGSYGACPKLILAEQRKWIELMEEQPVLFFRELVPRMRKARETLAGYLGAQPENLVYVTNATYAVNVVAQALAKAVLKPGDEILATNHEYGACKRAWMEHAVSKGAVWVEAQIPLPAPSQEELCELIWSKVTPQTKILFISHIASPTGVRLPAEELCNRAKKAGIIAFIDGAHVPGQMDLDLSTLQADIYTGNCHKWMCTPKGSAFLWASSEYKDLITPLVVSWGSVIPTAGDGFFVDEQEFLGTRDYSAYLSVPQGLDWMKANDWPTIQKRCRALKTYGINLLCTIDGVRPLLKEGSDPQTQLGAVLLPDQYIMPHMKDWLYDHKKIEVVVHTALGNNILRFSVHAHTSIEDIQALEKGVREYLSQFAEASQVKL